VLSTIVREWVPKHRRAQHTPPTRLEAGRRMADRRQPEDDDAQDANVELEQHSHSA
jgi:hypothetical protein